MPELWVDDSGERACLSRSGEAGYADTDRQTRLSEALFDANEDQSRAALWSTKVTGVQHCGDDAVVTAKREVFFDLASHHAVGKLRHAGHIFEEESARPKLPEQFNELPVEAVSWVGDQPVVIVDLAECLTRRPTSEEAKGLGAGQSQERPVIHRVGEVAVHECRVWKVEPVGGRAVRVVIGGRDDGETSLAETFTEPAGSGEEIDCHRPRAVGLRLGRFRVSHLLSDCRRAFRQRSRDFSMSPRLRCEVDAS